ncbi:MAG: hypothetical protein VKP62_03660 [Candidatus Sericytochromatia bacterium]|nr:hypothetical protein [Candidatus Sericytochromatia bacterium]
MNHDPVSARQSAGQGNFDTLRTALTADSATPEIVAIFQQIKNLRESDRSLRSIRRNLDLDNVPTLEPLDEPLIDEADIVQPGDLAGLLDAFISLKREHEDLRARFTQMSETAHALESKLTQLNQLLNIDAQNGQNTL